MVFLEHILPITMHQFFLNSGPIMDIAVCIQSKSSCSTFLTEDLFKSIGCKEFNRFFIVFLNGNSNLVNSKIRPVPKKIIHQIVSYTETGCGCIYTEHQMPDVGRMILKDNYRTDSGVSNFFGVVIDNIVQIIPDCLRDKHSVIGDNIFNRLSNIKRNRSGPSRLHGRCL